MSLLPLLPKLEWLEIGNGIITPNGMKHLGNRSRYGPGIQEKC